jgi:hypothetical protein
MKAIEKVFCEGCMHLSLKHSRRGSVIDWDCYHKDNLEIKETWWHVERIPIQKPKEINKNNDCKRKEKSDIPF